MLFEDVKKYYDLKTQADKLKEQMDTLKEEIVSEMNSRGKTEYCGDGVTAKLLERVTFEYNDEPGMIRWLETHGLSSYVAKKINTTVFNKDLKTSELLTEGLKNKYTKKTSITLTVTKNEPIDVSDTK